MSNATSKPEPTPDRGALIERIAEAMWNTRYRRFKWDDPSQFDPEHPERLKKREGFRRTAEAALLVMEEANRA